MAFFSVVPTTLLLSPNTLKTLMWWKKKKGRGERNTFLPLQSMAAEGAETLVEDAAFCLHGPGNIDGTE